VSLLGTVAALAGCLILGVFAWALRMEEIHWVVIPVLLICVVGGMVGSTVDSLLGAVFELRGKMSNSQINFLSTLAGGLAAMGVYLLISA
jgi:uncharacterized membrane protein